MNATLKINDSKEFGYDIWQTCDCENWSADKWNQSINSLISGLIGSLRSRVARHGVGVGFTLYSVKTLGNTGNLLIKKFQGLV